MAAPHPSNAFYRDGFPTLLACGALQAHDIGGVTDPLDEQVIAFGAVGVLVGIMDDVTDIDILAAGLLRYLVGHVKGLHGGPVAVRELVVRMEPGEMDHDLGGQALDDPVRELLDLLLGVVEARDDEIGELDMDA